MHGSLLWSEHSLLVDAIRTPPSNSVGISIESAGTGETSLLSPGLVEDIGLQASRAGESPRDEAQPVLPRRVPRARGRGGRQRLGHGRRQLRIAPPSMFRPVSTPAHEISTLAIFVLAVTTTIFVIVSGLLTYSVIRFRSRRPDDGSEPLQIYGSGPVEFAWTAVPVSSSSCSSRDRPQHLQRPGRAAPASRARGARRRPPGPHADLPRARIRRRRPQLLGTAARREDRPHREQDERHCSWLPLRLREVPRLGGLGPLDDQVAAGAIMWSPAR